MVLTTNGWLFIIIRANCDYSVISRSILRPLAVEAGPLTWMYVCTFVQFHNHILDILLLVMKGQAWMMKHMKHTAPLVRVCVRAYTVH